MPSRNRDNYNFIRRNKLVFVCANVRSIRNQFDEFRVIVEDCKPDVVGITESWLNDSIFTAEVHIPGYVVYRQDRPDTSRGIGGGVLLYVKADLSSVVKPEIGRDFVNSTWCEIPLKVAGISGSLTVGVVYRSPNSSVENNTLLFELMKQVSSKNTVIMGDFNYPDISWSEGFSGSHGSDFFKLTQDCFLHQHVCFPTREKNILDLVLSSDPHSVENVENVGKLGSSDHDIVRFNFICSVDIPNSVELVPNFSKADVDSISAFFSGINWVDLLQEVNTFKSWEIFMERINYVMKVFIPWKRRRSNNRKPRWMSRDVFLL